jgi:hypothetical protein
VIVVATLYLWSPWIIPWLLANAAAEALAGLT